MALILLKEYAERVGRDSNTVLQKAKRGNLPSARKIGRQWFIDENEAYTDNRITTGKYIDWRKPKP